MDRPLSGRVALVTGASRGIGQGIALRLAQAGADLVVAHYGESDAAGARETAGRVEAAGSRCWLTSGDVGDYGAAAGMVARAFDQAGRIDILVNNAGEGGDYWGPFHEMPPELWDRLLRVNLSSVFYVSREVVSGSIARQSLVGRVINIGSIQGLITNPWGKLSSYQAAKAGVAMLTTCLAAELGMHGTTVNCVAPGAIETASNLDPARFPGAAADAERFARRIPLGRRGMVEEVANLVAFLASDEASYITGQTIYADGGMARYGRFGDRPAGERG